MEDQVRILGRLEELCKKPGNNVCAECPERHPTWISLIIKPAFKGGEPLAVFVCQACSKHHHYLGKISEVKGLTMATKWSDEQLAIVTKTGNKVANSIYEGNMGEWDDDKEIITFDKEEEQKLRFEFIRNKYMQRKYFNEDAFHSTMAKLNPKYKKHEELAASIHSTRALSPRRASMATIKRYDELASSVHSTRAISPRRASMATIKRYDELASSVHSTRTLSPRRASMATTACGFPSLPPSSQKGASVEDTSPTQTPKETSTAAVPETPTKKAALQRNLKDDPSSQSPVTRRAIPSSSTLTNGRPRASSRVQREQQLLLATSMSDLDTDFMSDGSKRERRRSLEKKQPSALDIASSEPILSASTRGSRSNRRMSLAQAKAPSERNLRGSRPNFGKDPSERSLSGSRSSLGKDLSDQSLSESSQRGSRSRRSLSASRLSLKKEPSERSLRGSRPKLGKDPSERSLRGSRSNLGKDLSDQSLSGSSQSGSRRRRGSLQESDRSHSEKDVSGRRGRRQSLLKLSGEESESESEADFEAILNHKNPLLMHPLPVSLQSRALSTPTRASKSSRTSRTSGIPVLDGAQSMRAGGRSSLVLKDLVEGGNSRGGSSNNILDRRRRSMLQVNQRFSSRSLMRMEKSPPEATLSNSPQQHRKGRSMDPSTRSTRETGRSVQVEDSKRCSRTLSREKPSKEKTSRGKRSSIKDSSDPKREERSRVKRSVTMKEDSSGPKREERSPVKRSVTMKDRSDPHLSIRSRDAVMKDNSDPEKSARGKRSAMMKDTSDSDKSARGKRSSDRIRRDARTSSSRKSKSPGRIRKCVTTEIKDTKKATKKTPARCRTVPTLSELKDKPSKNSKEPNPNFDWTSPLAKIMVAEESTCGECDEEKIGKRRSKSGSKREKKYSSKSASPSKRKSTGDMDDGVVDKAANAKKRSSDPLKNKKADRKSMKQAPSKKDFSRSRSTGGLADADSEDVSRSKDNKGSSPNRKLSKGAGSASKLLGKQSSHSGSKKLRKMKRSSTLNDSSECKYKNLGKGVLTSSYSGGSLGLLMASDAQTMTDKKKDSKEKSFSGKHARSLSEHRTSASGVSDIIGVVSDLKHNATRRSMASPRFMSATAVAATAIAAISSNDKTSSNPKKDGKKKKTSLAEVKHNTYNDAMIAQWLAA